MSAAETHVAVLIVSFNGRKYLEECLTALLASEVPGIVLHPVVDNASSDGSLDFVAEQFPTVARVASSTNAGFAGGSNLGWEYIRRIYGSVQYLFLLNQDTVVEQDCIRRGVEFLQTHPETACVQPKVMLTSDRSLLNTAGNRSHYLGFGFVTGFQARDVGQYDRDDRIDFASGAAMFVRTDVIEQVGLFDEDFFMYLEDAEFGWKVNQIGMEVRRLCSVRVYHAYDFDYSFKHYFHLEKNRLSLLVVYYKWPTLVLFAPPILFMEAGQVLFALLHGVFRDRLRVYAFLFRKEQRARIWTRRRKAQARRVVGDREFMSRFIGAIDFAPITGPLVRFVANPLLAGYWSVARRVIFW